MRTLIQPHLDCLVTNPMKNEVEQIIERYERLKRIRSKWYTVFQTLYKFVLYRRMALNGMEGGTFFVKNVYDSCAATSAEIAGAALAGALWPSASESFDLQPLSIYNYLSDDYLFDDEEIKSYLERACKVVYAVMDAPESGLSLAINEYLQEDVIIGTAGLYAAESDDPFYPVLYSSISVADAVFDQNARGFIDTVYLEHHYTVKQIYQEYKDHEIPEAVKKKAEAHDWDEVFCILETIEPRLRVEDGAEGAEAMPFQNKHILLDGKKKMREKGFEELPTFINRFTKLPRELYGRGPAFKAMPEIRDINVTRESFGKATGKQLEPPIGIYNEMVVGGGEVNISQNAKVMLYTGAGKIPPGSKAIEPIFIPGDLKTAAGRIAELTEIIRQAFMVDRLLDFNNKTRMTFGEAQLRNDFRNQSLGSIFARQISEVFQPLIKRTFMILYRKGLLGVRENSPEYVKLLNQGVDPFVVPDVIADMLDRKVVPFVPRMISPAARALQAEQQAGLTNFTAFVGKNILPIAPQAAQDVVDYEDITRNAQRLFGAPSSSIRSKEAVKNMQNARAKQGEMMQQQQAMQAGADVAKTGAEAMKAASMAEVPQ